MAVNIVNPPDSTEDVPNNNKSLIDLKIDYNLTPPTRLGVGFSGGTFLWKNGSLTVTDKTASSFNPTIYSSFSEGNDRSQPNKPIDSSEYFPLATLTAVNTEDQKGVQGLGIRLSSTIQVSLEGNSQGLQFAPLNVEPIEIGIADFASEDPRTDQIKFDNLFSGYQPLQITNPQTGAAESPSFYFGYVGAVEGEGEGDPQQPITKDQLVLPGTNNSVDFPDGETVTYTLYGRIFSIEDIISPIKITGITEDTGVEGDFRTSDNTLIFNGTAEAGSNVEVFLDLDGESDSIGTTTADANGNWSYDHTAVEISDSPDNPDNLDEKKYKLTAESTNSYGEINSTTKLLEVDTDYDIYPDLTDPSIASNEPLKEQINEAVEYWEDIILNDIPDVNLSEKNGSIFVDDLKIKFRIGEIDGEGNTLAAFETKIGVTEFRGKYRDNKDPLTGNPIPTFNFLPSYGEIVIDSADINEISDPKNGYGLQTLKHEIAHAIGFNTTTLTEKELVKNNINNNYFFDDGNGFKGENALAAYKELGGKDSHQSVPLQDGSATDSIAHWNELLFPDGNDGSPLLGYKVPGTDELMTTSTPQGGNALLSKLTLGAFQDLGFKVDDTNAEDLTVFQGANTSLGFVENPLFGIEY
jgi:hypothetical protein